MAGCLTAWLHREDSPEAEAGAVALADGLNELRILREALTKKS